MKVSLVKEMRAIDKRAGEEYGLPEIVLMENAGRAVAAAFMDMLGGVRDKLVCVFAGSGNNGGDALSAARYLSNRGARIKVFIVGNPDHFGPSTRAMHGILQQMGIEQYRLENNHDWDRLRVSLKFAAGMLDGILGTGFKGQLREKIARVVTEINQAGKPVLSIDIPSGVEADTGKADVAIQATRTVTLGLPKIGQLLSPGADFCGNLQVDDIGIPQEMLTDAQIKQSLIDDDLAAKLLPKRTRAAHKGTCGRILIVAGSRGMTGAATLCASSALRAGAGIVTLCVPASLHDIMEGKLTEVMTQPMPENKAGSGRFGGEAAEQAILQMAETYDAVLIGPGLGRAEETQQFVRSLVAKLKKPVILDADAIYAFRGHAEDLAKLAQPPILTPHLGEMAGLVGISISELRESLLPIAREAAAEYASIFVVKSECTLVVYPDGTAFFTTKGNNGMATAGSGDVLAGTIAGLMREAEPQSAPVLGVYLHGFAGDIAYEEKGEGLIASDIRDHLPVARKKLREIQAKLQ